MTLRHWWGRSVWGLATVAYDSRTLWQAIVLGLRVAAGVVAFVRWAAGEVRQVAALCLAVVGAVWVYGVLVVGSSTAFFGLLIVGPLVVPQLPRYRSLAAAALIGFITGVGAARLLVTSDAVSSVLVSYVLYPAGITAILVGLMFPNKRLYDVVADLQEARDREAELAVARERIRFASDLHDIQGHTLHVVKLKIALARKLLHSDLARAESELAEVHALVGDTIVQTKDLAHAQRRVNLAAELENAKNLFEAAGIEVRVDRPDALIDEPTGELLGQVLRETTTNILRHAQATQVRISLSESSISIVNDGAQREAPAELRGLARLQERVALQGGELTVTSGRGSFRTAACFPRTSADAALPAAAR